MPTPQQSIEELLKQSGAVLHRHGKKNEIWKIPSKVNANENMIFTRSRGHSRRGDFRAAANEMAELKRLLKKAGHEDGNDAPPVTRTYPAMPSTTATAAAVTAPEPVPAQLYQQPIEYVWDANNLPKAGAYLMTITPEVAYEMLQRNLPHNRNIRESTLDPRARDIVSGNWVLNGATICFDVNGNMFDGQHRLWSIIEANLPVQSYVIFGLPERAYATSDTGITKKTTDFLNMRQEKNVAVLSAVTRLLIFRERNQLNTGVLTNHKLKPTTQEILDFIDRNPLVRESAAWASTNAKHYLPPSVGGFMHFACSKVQPEAWAKFATQLVEGTGLSTNDPVYLLRKRVIEGKSERAKLDTEYLMALAIKAWNEMRAGRKLGNLVWKAAQGEKFPELNLL